MFGLALLLIIISIVFGLGLYKISSVVQILVYSLAIIILVVSFIRVRSQFLKYHGIEYNEVKVALWLYFLFDFVGYVFIILINLLLILNVELIVDILLVYITGLCFPIFQVIVVFPF